MLSTNERGLLSVLTNERSVLSVSANQRPVLSSPGAGLADVVHDVARGVLDAGLSVLKVLDPILSGIKSNGGY